MLDNDVAPPGAPVATSVPHAVLVYDGADRLVHASGPIDSLLGAPPPLDVRGLQDLLASEAGDGALPVAGESASVSVRRAPDGRWLHVSTHQVAVPDMAGRLTVVALSAGMPGERNPAIDDQIAAVLSHELRTPITTIYAGSQILLGDRQMSPDTQREMLSDIRVEAERLYRLVEDLLVANVGRGGIEIVPEPILLQRTLPRVGAAEAARWPHVEFSTTVASELPAVRADELYVEHIVRDLLANAGSFSSAGGTVRLDARQGDGQVEVRVLDEGPGITEDAADRLFRPFRAEPAGRARPGPGLGLYVCKLLVEAMGGTVWARPRPGGGSEFGFSLPPYGDEADERTEPVQPAGSA